MTFRLTSGFLASLHSINAISPSGVNPIKSVFPDPGKPNSLIAKTSGKMPSLISVMLIN